MSKSIEKLLKELSKRESSATVFNPYRDPGQLNNLREYLNYLVLNPFPVMLVGESPGYKGCRLTGIPFTSGFVVRNSPHRMFEEIGKKIVLEKEVSEATGTIMWKYLGRDKPVPILWNSYPFHPFRRRKPESNRKPTSPEVQEGIVYVKMIYEIFKPQIICSIGRVGEGILKETFPEMEIHYIRHPSRGGKSEFMSGMDSVFQISDIGFEI